MDDSVHLVDSGDCDAAKLTRSEVISFVPPGENLPWSAPGGKIEFYKPKYMENQHFLVGILWGVTQRVTPKERPIETIGLGLSPLGKICPRPLWTEKLNFQKKTYRKATLSGQGDPLGGPQGVSRGAPRWRGDVDGRGEVDGAARSTALSAARSMARRSRWCDEVDGAARSNRWGSVGIGRNR